MLIKEGMQDTHMSMFEKFIDDTHSLVNKFNITTEKAAKIVAYRERTSVLDHRLATIARGIDDIAEAVIEATNRFSEE